MYIFERTAIKRSTILASTLLASTAATAQPIDYGSLEMMFDEAVTTSATGKPQRASEAPVTMDIITAEQIRRSGASEIPEVLRTLAGLDVIQRTAGQFDVNVRGYNQQSSPRLLVLINGRQVYLEHFGLTAWAALPVEMNEIRQIEVVKGPNTALFGFNAVSGVINIITFNPLFDDVNTFEARVGTDGEIAFSGVSTLQFGDQGGLRLGGKFVERDAFEDVSLRTNSGLDKVERYNFQADAQFRLSDKITVGIDGSYSSADVNEFNAGFLPSASFYETYSLRGTVSLDSDKFGIISADVYTNWLNNELPAFPFELSNKITVAKLQNLKKLNATNTVRALVEYRKNETDMDQSGGFSPITGGDQKVTTTYEMVSLGAMWDLQASDKLSFTASGRVDFVDMTKSGFDVGDFLSPFPNAAFDRKETEYSINAGMVYALSDVGKLRFSYARGISFPSQIDFGVTAYDLTTVPGVGTIPFLLISDPSLVATPVQNVEIGYDHSFESGAQLRLSAFYQKHDDVRGFLSVLTPNIGLGGLPVSNVSNIGTSEMFGIEAGLKGTAGDFRYDVNYTYIDINDDLPDTGAPLGQFIQYPAQYENAVANHAINASLGYTKGKFDVDVFASYRSATEQLDGNFPVFFNAPVDDYFRVDAKAAYRFNDTFAVSVRGTSLFEDKHFEGPQYGVERQVMVSLTARF